MIREQASQFPVSRNFDYRELFSEVNNTLTLNEDQFDKYFCTDLDYSFVNKITESEKSRYVQHSNQYKSARKLCIKMIVALLCFAMNPACCFFTNSTWLSFLYKWASG